MANYLEYYTINLYSNNRKVEVEPTSYSFSLVDSIYNLYAYCVFELHDYTGLMQEGLLTTNGIPYKIEYGIKEIINSCTYVIQQDNLNEIDEPGYLAGRDSIFALHEWQNTQTIKNKGYNDRISFIIKDLVNSYNFSKVVVNDTGNQDYWYQIYQTDGKFIEDVLLPNAFSKNANSTPFYAFTTTNNEFHFRNYYDMSIKEKAADIEYIVNVGTTAEKGVVAQENKTSMLKRWSVENKNIWPMRKRKLFKIDRNTGNIVETENKITENPLKNNLDYPVFDSDTTYYTGYDFFQFTENTTGEKENLDGYKINAHKKDMFFDRFMLVVPMNPKLHAGKTIKLRIYTKDDDKESKRFSGNYIIENCEQVWNGISTRGYTKLIVGRKYIQVPTSYLLKPKLLS